MQRILAGIYLLLSIGHLIYELVEQSFHNGLEAVLTVGFTGLGIYLAWIVLTNRFAPKQRKET